ncbi:MULTISPECIES: hypothetical protein [Pseudomonas]
MFSDAEDFNFRYHEDASPPMAISLSMPVRHDEFLRRELHLYLDKGDRFI